MGMLLAYRREEANLKVISDTTKPVEEATKVVEPKTVEPKVVSVPDELDLLDTKKKKKE